MYSKVILLVTGLILAISACKEAAPDVSVSEEVVTEQQALTIPERPTEIEILDLTEEVDLFVVVAGAYSSISGAQKKANQLKKAGFANADVVQRPGSKLFSALVERFDSEAAAEAFATEIGTNNEIKSYVYKLDD